MSKQFINEARIAVESAIAVAEVVARTEITESQSFNQLIIYLHDAAEALAKAQAGEALPELTPRDRGILAAYAECGGDSGAAAKKLGVSRVYVNRVLRKFRIIEGDGK